MTDKEALVAMLKRVGVEVEGPQNADGIRAFGPDGAGDWQRKISPDVIAMTGDYADCSFHFDANGMLVKMRLES